MLEILDILNWATRPIHPPEEYWAIDQKSLPYWEEIGKIFPTKFINELDELEDEKHELISSEHFERGLWLGLRLGQFAEQGPRGGVRDS